MAVVLWVGKTDLGMTRIWRAEVKLGKAGQKFFTSLPGRCVTPPPRLLSDRMLLWLFVL